MSDLICLVSLTTGKMLRARKGEYDLVRGDLCLVESEFGGDLARVVDTEGPVCRHPNRAEEAPKILRKADAEDERRLEWLHEREQRAFAFCLDRIRSRNLPMKLTAVRFYFSEKKGVFF